MGTYVTNGTKLRTVEVIQVVQPVCVCVAGGFAYESAILLYGAPLVVKNHLAAKPHEMRS